MAKLSAFQSDTRAIQDGAWVRVNEALYDDLEILTRGYTDEFVDAQKLRLMRVAETYGGDQTRIPNAVHREISAGLARDFLVLGIKNLNHDDGSPVELGDFLTMLDDPQYNRLARATFEAAGRVTTRAVAQTKAAEGNSETALPGN